MVEISAITLVILYTCFIRTVALCVAAHYKTNNI